MLRLNSSFVKRATSGFQRKTLLRSPSLVRTTDPIHRYSLATLRKNLNHCTVSNYASKCNQQNMAFRGFSTGEVAGVDYSIGRTSQQPTAHEVSAIVLDYYRKKFGYDCGKINVESIQHKPNVAGRKRRGRNSNTTTVWTATFTCPITGTKINTGILKSHLKPSVFGDGNSFFVQKDGKIFYNSEANAVRACNAAVIDCLSNEVVQSVCTSSIIAEQYCEGNPLVDLSGAIDGIIGKSSNGFDSVGGKSAGQATDHKSTAVPKFIDVLGILNACYQAKHPIQVESMKISDRNGKINTRWTASFTCPSTFAKINAGTVKAHLRRSILARQDTPSRGKDGKIYYKSKLCATRACAASVLDCMSVEDVVKIADPAIKNLIAEKLCEENSIINMSTANANINEIKREKGRQITTMLNNFYGKLCNRVDGTADYKLSFCFHNFHNLWSSTFTCPITGKNIDSGDIKPSWMSTIFGSEIPVGTIKKNGRIFYRKKSDAKRACAASVLDCLSGQINGIDHKSYTLESYCVGEPIVDLSAAINETIGNRKRAIRDEQGNPVIEYEPGKALEAHFSEDTTVGLSGIIDDVNGIEKQTFHCEQENSVVKKETIKTLVNYEHRPKGWDQNPTNVIATLHRLYNPKDLRMSMIFENLRYKSADTECGGLVWTAEFDSPVTGETFKAGNLKACESRRINGESYYATKKLAKAAAIGRSADCFLHRNGWVSHLEGGEETYRFSLDEDYTPFCIDEPYDSPSDVRIVMDKYIPPPKKEETEEMTDNISPKSVINSHYGKVLRGPLGQDFFSTESVDVEVDGTAQQYWTSTFECPISGKIFPCGTLISVEKEASQNIFPATKRIDGVIYYHKRNYAEHAAAGRAFDVLSASNFFSSFGYCGYKVVPQFCEESPYSYTDEYYDDEDGFDEDDGEEDDDDEDDFVIRDVPRPGHLNASKSGIQTTIDVLLDAWADHRALHDEPKCNISNSDAVSTAISWLQQMKSEATGSSIGSPKGTLSSLRQTTVSTFSCNAILKALANMKSSAKTEDTEQLATDIIKLMIELSGIDRNEALPCKPDVVTFNSYIRCLQSTSEGSANRAESFLQKMLDGGKFEGYTLPKPDCDTFHAVMRHWQSQSKIDCHKKISALFSRLELTVASTSNALKPNKETFLIVLRSLVPFNENKAYANDRHQFFPKEATKWIERMEKYFSECDDDLVVDTDIYNAALPLTTDACQDDYINDLFKRSVDFPRIRNKMDPSRVDAVNIEYWFQSMERMCKEEGKIFAAPNIDTYEAVVQAWLRNCSEEGLENAERWAFRTTDAAATDYDINPRFDTFRPLMLAWAHSGSEKGPEKIHEMTKRLDLLSETIPELKPNGDISSLHILAWRNHLLRRANGTGQKSPFKITKNCTDDLCDMVGSAGGSENFNLNSEVFGAVIEMWNHVKTKHSNPNQSNVRQRINSEILRVVKAYNDYMDSKGIWNAPIDEKEDTESANSSPREKRTQILDLFLLGDVIHRKMMQGMLSAETERNSTRVVEEHFHEFERFLLRRQRYFKTVRQDDWELFANEEMPPFPDDLFREALKWCKYLTSTRRNGDAARVAMNIFNQVLMQKEDEAFLQSWSAEVIDVIDTVVSNEDDKIMIMNKIVSDISGWNDGKNSVLAAMKDKLPENVDMKEALKMFKTVKGRGSGKRRRLRKRKSRR